ncbi:hypothetical protein CA3LBN_001122 [Candidozyma haemuli]|uniref:HECT-type E3 ubiquitin transferase n=1 Tax=Candidozyma haemuli TaxID=45357 RepID=A0ABX8I389_9ASCO|nr:hypothetical protein CA3LBN_001122 [[Candida] haemuloni]
MRDLSDNQSAEQHHECNDESQKNRHSEPNEDDNDGVLQDFAGVQVGQDLDEEHEGFHESSSDGDESVREFTATISPSNHTSGLRSHRDLIREVVGQERTHSGTNLIEVVQRLVGNIEGSPFSRQSTEFENLISNLSQRDDPFIVLESLNELSERLLMMNGITAERLIPSNKFARALVDILREPLFEDHLELHLVTCRCLFNFLEVNQDFIHDALTNGAVEVLIIQLLDIKYIDLTEQALQALEMISRERISHNLIVSNDGLLACVQNLDFLTIHAQRKCLFIISNSCLNISESNFQKVKDIIHQLFDVVKGNSDDTVREHACLALSRIAMSFKYKRRSHEELFADGQMLDLILNVISGSCGEASKETLMSFKVSLSLLESLQLMASTSPKISEMLLGLNAGRHLFYALEFYNKKHEKRPGSDLTSDSIREVSYTSVMAAPKEILLNILRFIGALTPTTYDLSESPFVFIPINRDERGTISKETPTHHQRTIDETETFLHWAWPVVLKVFLASMESEIRKMALINMFRVLTYIDSENSILVTHMSELTSIIASLVSAAKSDLLSGIGLESLNNSTISNIIPSVAIINCVFEKEFLNCLLSLKKEGVFKDIEYIAERLNSFILDINGNYLENDRVPSLARFSTFANPELDFSRLSDQLPKTALLSRAKKGLDQFRRISNDLVLNLSGDESTSGSDLSRSVNLVLNTESPDPLHCETLWNQLQDLLLHDTTNFTSYELVTSGVNEVFSSHFMNPNNVDVLHTPLGRFFYSVILQNSKAIRRLIDLFLEALSRAESFEVISVTDKSPSGSPRHASNLARQIRLRLVPHTKASKIPVEAMTICVQAVATFRSIESFLIQRTEQGCQSTPSNVLINERTSHENECLFYLNGDVVPSDTTIFGAIFASANTKDDLCRQKVRISRFNLMSSALNVLKKFGSSPEILEVEYFDEVGSGLGPTLEFYSSVSHEFQRSDLNMWRASGTRISIEPGHFVDSENGLFPKPFVSTQHNSQFKKKIDNLFYFLGVFMARALFDCRIVDIDLNPQFYRMLIAKSTIKDWTYAPTLTDLLEVDPSLFRSLKSLLEMSTSKHEETDPIEEMELYFVLQDDASYELVPNGANLKVTGRNVHDYVHAMINAVLKDGILCQIQKFAEGFSTVFPIQSLMVFYPEELRKIFGAIEEDWSERNIFDAIEANHGYTNSSKSVIRLVQVISNFDEVHRRQFLRFLTGASKLPIGGFKCLHPRFTVVRKDPESGLTSDDYLPSVMTLNTSIPTIMQLDTLIKDLVSTAPPSEIRKVKTDLSAIVPKDGNSIVDREIAEYLEFEGHATESSICSKFSREPETGKFIDYKANKKFYYDFGKEEASDFESFKPEYRPSYYEELVDLLDTYSKDIQFRSYATLYVMLDGISELTKRIS